MLSRYRSGICNTIFWIGNQVFRLFVHIFQPVTVFPWSAMNRMKTTAPVQFMLSSILKGSPRAVLLRASVLTALIAIADWRIEGNIPLGFLYLFTMLLVGNVCTRWQIAMAAGLCTFLTEEFDSFAWYPAAGIPRDILVFAAFFCMGLFVYESARNRRIALLHMEEIESEVQARREAEEQLKILVESGPAGDRHGRCGRPFTAGQQRRASALWRSSRRAAGKIDPRLSARVGEHPEDRREPAVFSNRDAVPRTARGWRRFPGGCVVLHDQRERGRGWPRW